jgi:hypothetical protein
MALALSRNQMKTFIEYHPTILHDLHESVPFLYTSTGTGPYNAWLDPIVIDEWNVLAYHEIEEMTKRGVPGVWTHGFYDGWAPNYMFYVANGHNAIGRFYETFGNSVADTQDRNVGAQAQRDWFRPNPPQPAREVVAAQQRQHAGIGDSSGDEFRRQQQGSLPQEFLSEEQTIRRQSHERRTGGMGHPIRSTASRRSRRHGEPAPPDGRRS